MQVSDRPRSRVGGEGESIFAAVLFLQSVLQLYNFCAVLLLQSYIVEKKNFKLCVQARDASGPTKGGTGRGRGWGGWGGWVGGAVRGAAGVGSACRPARPRKPPRLLGSSRPMAAALGSSPGELDGRKAVGCASCSTSGT
jgi:hypothetical protein